MSPVIGFLRGLSTWTIDFGISIYRWRITKDSPTGSCFSSAVLSEAGLSGISSVDQLMIDGEKYQFESIRDVQLVIDACEVQSHFGFADFDAPRGFLT
jgi:hypothetical protein